MYEKTGATGYDTVILNEPKELAKMVLPVIDVNGNIQENSYMAFYINFKEVQRCTNVTEVCNMIVL